jgi:phage terminase large subunit-like protein
MDEERVRRRRSPDDPLNRFSRENREHRGSSPDAPVSALPEGDYDWEGKGRDEQWFPDGDWRVWLILAGRGFGKTRTGAETVRRLVQEEAAARFALVGETAADVRDVMIEGPDGILQRSPPHERPKYEPSKRRITWPNGIVATAYAGADPEQLRGPQHGFAWVDELAKFKYARETWDNLMFGLRMEHRPRCLVTTTPRPIRLLRELLAPDRPDVAVTRGSTYDNAENLPKAFMEDILRRYEGTTVGRQELYAELLDETPGALWTRTMIDRLRVRGKPALHRVLIGVDPSTSGQGLGDACGIVVAGIDDPKDSTAYVLEDATLHASPNEWAKEVARLQRKYNADGVIAEGNQGGGLVTHVLYAAEQRMRVKLVNAKKSKKARAEPVVALYEREKVRHVGTFPDLEDEMVNWLPGMRSPNRLDALVWVLDELMLSKNNSQVQATLFGQGW